MYICNWNNQNKENERERRGGNSERGQQVREKLHTVVHPIDKEKYRERQRQRDKEGQRDRRQRDKERQRQRGTGKQRETEKQKTEGEKETGRDTENKKKEDTHTHTREGIYTTCVQIPTLPIVYYTHSLAQTPQLTNSMQHPPILLNRLNQTSCQQTTQR